MGKGRLLSTDDLEKMDGQIVWIEDLKYGNEPSCHKVDVKNKTLIDKNEWFWKIGNNTIEVYEYIEEPKTYKTSEMIAMLEENPKLKFKDFDDKEFVAIATDEIYGKSRICWNGVFESPLYVVVGEGEKKWALIEEPQEVTFIEAVKAYKDGKSIFCKLDGVITLKPSHKNYLFNERAVSVDEILLGKWFVEEQND